MRAITVRQPWAWQIINQGKNVENRTRNIAGKYRGPIAIHAALKPDQEALARLACARPRMGHRAAGVRLRSHPWRC